MFYERPGLLLSLPAGLASSMANLVACLSRGRGFDSRPGQFFLSPKWWNLPMPGIRCCGRERNLVWIGMTPEPSAEEDAQCSRTNTDLEGGECSRVFCFSVPVFESRGRGFDPRPGQFFLCNTYMQHIHKYAVQSHK